MQRKLTLAKVLAIVGAVLVWLPLLAPVIFSIARLIRGGTFFFDYLMPAELFPLVLIGGGMLVAAALLAQEKYKLILWSLVFCVALILGGQGLAVATGLASGETEATGFPFLFVVGLFILMDLLVVIIGVRAILLLRELFNQANAQG